MKKSKENQEIEEPAIKKDKEETPTKGHRRASVFRHDVKFERASLKNKLTEDDHKLIKDVALSCIEKLEEEILHKEDVVEDKGDFFRTILLFADSRYFNGLILMVIFLNTAILIAQTSQTVAVRQSWVFSALDSVFLGIYIMEIVIKLYAWRKSFFNEGWNILDFSIVVCSLVDFTLPLIIQNVSGFNGAAIFRVLRIFRAIRAIRALRVLKTIRFLNTLQAIMTTLLQSIRSIGAIVILISLFMYMFAVVGRGLYAKADPDHFGNLFVALFTLFQLLTLDDWFDVYTTVTRNDPGRTHIIIYLLLYIVVEYFIFLNLFVAVLVDNFQLTLETQTKTDKKKASQKHDEGTLDANYIKSDSETTWKELPPNKELKSVKQCYPSLDETLEPPHGLINLIELSKSRRDVYRRLWAAAKFGAGLGAEFATYMFPAAVRDAVREHHPETPKGAYDEQYDGRGDVYYVSLDEMCILPYPKIKKQ